MKTNYVNNFIQKASREKELDALTRLFCYFNEMEGVELKDVEEFSYDLEDEIITESGVSGLDFNDRELTASLLSKEDREDYLMNILGRNVLINSYSHHFNGASGFEFDRGVDLQDAYMEAMTEYSELRKKQGKYFAPREEW